MVLYEINIKRGLLDVLWLSFVINLIIKKNEVLHSMTWNLCISVLVANVGFWCLLAVSSRLIGNIGYHFDYIGSYWQYRHRAKISGLFQTLLLNRIFLCQFTFSSLLEFLMEIAEPFGNEFCQSVNILVPFFRCGLNHRCWSLCACRNCCTRALWTGSDYFFSDSWNSCSSFSLLLCWACKSLSFCRECLSLFIYLRWRRVIIIIFYISNSIS